MRPNIMDKPTRTKSGINWSWEWYRKLDDAMERVNSDSKTYKRDSSADNKTDGYCVTIAHYPELYS